MNDVSSQLLYKYHLKEVAFVGDRLAICPQLDSRVAGLQNRDQARNLDVMPPQDHLVQVVGAIHSCGIGAVLAEGIGAVLVLRAS